MCIRDSEKLKESPKFQINGVDVSISEVGDNQWKGLHLLSNGGELKIVIEGEDVSGNKGTLNVFNRRSKNKL